MAYARSFFDFQLRFAQRLATQLHLPLADVLYQYTTFTKSFGEDDWPQYIAGLAQSHDPVEWTYQWYLPRCDPEPGPDDQSYDGHGLFGCFYYTLREAGTVIRPHLIKNDLPGMRPLSRERFAIRREELRRMFAHIHDHEPQAKAVRGNSWLYNLDAYRRLYPPAYTTNMATSEDDDEFQFLALWGQCFDRDWQPKPDVAQELLRRVEALTDLAGLRLCFPYQIRQPECAVAEFYTYFDIS